jgi:polar amino acid transport system substrate-binding protein
MKEVLWHTPNDWEGYVNEEGKGLYVDLVHEVFSARHIRVKRETVPWKRALHNVQVGKADFTGGTSPIPGFYVSHQPLVQGWEVIFFRKGTIKRPVLDHLKGKKGVWPMGYIEEFPQDIKAKLQGGEIANREQGVRMILSGRADYYLDNLVQLADTLRSITFERDKFECGEIFSDTLYMLFTKNNRGRKLRDLYDQEIERLAKTDALKKIYAKWSFEVPHALTTKADSMDALQRCEKRPGL